MSENKPASLSAFRKDLDRLAEEEAIGAELLAPRDVIAQLGIFWETAEKLSDLHARQARHWVEDHLATWSALASASASGDWAGVLGAHVERRCKHLAEGMQQGTELMTLHSQKTANTLHRLWDPYLAVVGRDWQGLGRGRGSSR